MKNPTPQLQSLTILVAGLLSAVSLTAQTLTFVPSAPTPTNGDVYNFTASLTDADNVNDGTTNYVDGAANDAFTYVAGDRASQGQTFTTGPEAGTVTAIWIRQVGYTNDLALTYWSFAVGGPFTFRITDPSQVGAAGFVIDSETYTITGTEPNNPGGFSSSTTGTGLWLRFGLTNAVTLQPNTTYGFDVTSTGGDFFESWGTSNNVYTGGTAYNGSTTGGTDDTLNPLAGDRAFLVEFNGGTFAPPPVIAPTITNEPANAMVSLGASATFSLGVDGTAPYTYQWYYQTNTLLTGATNSTFSVAGTTNNVGGYSVVVSNSSGSATSRVARLSVILPSLVTNLNFNVAGSGILDANGVAIPFPTRLPGTGASLSSPDSYLLFDTSSGTLAISSTTCDYNGQLIMEMAEAPGINLSSLIGFDGTQDFSVTGTFTNLPTDFYVNYDQVGVYAGTSSTNMVRGGLIFNSDFANLSSYAVATPGSNDLGIVTGAAPPAEMVVTIARSGGNWSVNVNGVDVTPGVSLNFLNAYSDLTVGVFALDTSGLSNTDMVNGFGASLFSGPQLSIGSDGSNLTLNWNVIGSGLESNTDLANSSGWTPVAGTANTDHYVVPLPATGSMFYRIAQ